MPSEDNNNLTENIFLGIINLNALRINLHYVLDYVVLIKFYTFS